jgi:Ser-tRNA(Ala) deacylase AlaX
MITKLLYLEEMDQYTNEAMVEMVATEGGRNIVILDQTNFYPQGGGQPYDTGLISSETSKFSVEEVRFDGGVVKHIGIFLEGVFQPGDCVICRLDVERRKLHTRLHSAGHIVDMSLKQLGVAWRPGKGYHFPDGPYVEYSGSLEGVTIEQLKTDLETVCNQIIQTATKTHTIFVSKVELATICEFVPDYIPEGKPSRVVLYGNFGIPCGGTHVSNLGEIGQLKIRKIKPAGENIRVSYQIIK